jgi:hypothetical protein
MASLRFEQGCHHGLETQQHHQAAADLATDGEGQKNPIRSWSAAASGLRSRILSHPATLCCTFAPAPAVTASIRLASSPGARELFTRRDTGQHCSTSVRASDFEAGCAP